jgi:hypothetical protein
MSAERQRALVIRNMKMDVGNILFRLQEWGVMKRQKQWVPNETFKGC